MCARLRAKNVERNQIKLQQQRRRADDILDIMEAEQFGFDSDAPAERQREIEARHFANLNILRAIAGAGLQAIPDHVAALRNLVQRPMPACANQTPGLRRQLHQLRERRSVIRHRWEHVHMIMHQR